MMGIKKGLNGGKIKQKQLYSVDLCFSKTLIKMNEI